MLSGLVRLMETFLDDDVVFSESTWLCLIFLFVFEAGSHHVALDGL